MHAKVDPTAKVVYGRVHYASGNPFFDSDCEVLVEARCLNPAMHDNDFDFGEWLRDQISEHNELKILDNYATKIKMIQNEETMSRKFCEWFSKLPVMVKTGELDTDLGRLFAIEMT